MNLHYFFGFLLRIYILPHNYVIYKLVNMIFLKEPLISRLNIHNQQLSIFYTSHGHKRLISTQKLGQSLSKSSLNVLWCSYIIDVSGIRLLSFFFFVILFLIARQRIEFLDQGLIPFTFDYIYLVLIIIHQKDAWYNDEINGVGQHLKYECSQTTFLPQKV